MISFRWWQTTSNKKGHSVTRYWNGYFLFWYLPLWITLEKEYTKP